MVNEVRQAGDSGGGAMSATLNTEERITEIVDSHVKGLSDRFLSMSDDVRNFSARFAAEDMLSDIAELYFSIHVSRRTSLMKKLLELSN
jgi:hypothetical protein